MKNSMKVMVLVVCALGYGISRTGATSTVEPHGPLTEWGAQDTGMAMKHMFRSVCTNQKSHPCFMGFTTDGRLVVRTFHEALRILANRYNALQQRFGDSSESDWSQEIEELFSENFSKTANDQVLVAERAELQNQILDLREAGVGGWKVKVRHVIPSVDGYSCTLDYELHTEHAGNFRVIAILTSANGLHIDAIDEVYYKMEQ